MGADEWANRRVAAAAAAAERAELPMLLPGMVSEMLSPTLERLDISPRTPNRGTDSRTASQMRSLTSSSGYPAVRPAALSTEPLALD